MKRQKRCRLHTAAGRDTRMKAGLSRSVLFCSECLHGPCKSDFWVQTCIYPNSVGTGSVGKDFAGKFRGFESHNEDNVPAPSSSTLFSLDDRDDLRVSTLTRG